MEALSSEEVSCAQKRWSNINVIWMQAVDSSEAGMKDVQSSEARMKAMETSEIEF